MITRDSLVIKTRFHNDRTEKQGNTIIDQLVALGVDRKNLSLFVNSRPEESIENRKTSVKLVARKKK
jgi:tryptophanyl-tRNA synthetase